MEFSKLSQIILFRFSYSKRVFSVKETGLIDSAVTSYK